MEQRVCEQVQPGVIAIRGNSLVTVEARSIFAHQTFRFHQLARNREPLPKPPERANAPLIVFLDACRDNPFSEGAPTPPQDTHLAIDRQSVGLALPDIPGRNLLFWYATNPGERANDACPTEGLRRSRILRQLRCDVWRGAAGS